MNSGVRPARAADVDAVVDLIETFRREKIMLARTREDILRALPWFVVAETGGAVLGCASLHVYHRGLAEVRSLAVRTDAHGRGWGRALVEGLEELARRQSLATLCALTVEPAFFERLGFHRVDKALLPEKIWKDCASCAFLDDCREIALLKPLT